MTKIQSFINLTILFLFVQSVFGQKEQCLTEILFREKAKKDPGLIQKRQEIEDQIANYVASGASKKTSAAVRIIPVVFHVIHENGLENISDAQIEDQIRILNEDFRRLNPDTTDTPLAFEIISADCNIEFRLAKKDPWGNCTNGIIRIFSHQTNNSFEDIKSLSWWDNTKYLNIWTVSSIYNYVGSTGTILGYATYPGGNPASDGIVLRADCVGSIGTAAASFFDNKGRAATHEVGHWLSLVHVWGDAICGNDQVADTPVQEEANSGCPSYPHITCSNAPAGDMFINFMDYTKGICQNAFTNGQKLRMDAILSGIRSNLVSSANNIATGTDIISNPICAPVADFIADNKMICEGSSVTFSDQSWNGDPSSWSWIFAGGTPSSSVLSNPSVQYNSPGTYSVSLTTSNSSGGDNITNTDYIYVSPNTASYLTPYSEGFETFAFSNGDWILFNDDNGASWNKTTEAFYSGGTSLKINNFSDNLYGEIDELVSPSINLTGINYPELQFRLAYCKKNAFSKPLDKLSVSVSNDCGQTWTQRFVKENSDLVTTSERNYNFIPSVSDWRLETVNLYNVANNDNVRVKFTYINDSRSNNIYIDDINISGVTGFNEDIASSLQFMVYPNPTSNSTISFNLIKNSTATLNLFDVLGRTISTYLNEQELNKGKHQFELNEENISSPGIYFMHLELDGQLFIQKISVSK